MRIFAKDSIANLATEVGPGDCYEGFVYFSFPEDQEPLWVEFPGNQGDIPFFWRLPDTPSDEIPPGF